jgi:Chaperone of endosialidase
MASATILSDNGVSSGSAGLKSGGGNDGTLLLQTANSSGTATTAVTVDNAQNVGVGVTPSAWWSSGKSLQVKQASFRADSSNNLFVTNNVYFDGANYRYINSSYAQEFAAYNGAFTWALAPSGTAGATASFTQAMVLDSSGNLGVGVTPAAWYSTNVKALQLSSFAGVSGNTSSGYATLSNNAYATGPNDATQWAYTTTGNPSSLFQLTGQGARWMTAPSGTAGGAITFTQAMTLNASGNLLLGASSYQANTPRLYVTASSQGNSSNNIVWVNDSAASPSAAMHVWSFSGTTPGAGNFVDAYYNGVTTLAFRIAGNGNVTNANNSYGSTSDIKLKENIVDATPKLADLMQVRIRNYNLKTEPEHKQLGVVAQELETVFPGMVEETPDFETVTTTDEEGKETSERVATGTTTKSVKYSVFVPMLIKAIQEQNQLITSLTERITALEAK